jgi:hypothetical protein
MYDTYIIETRKGAAGIVVRDGPDSVSSRRPTHSMV